MERMVRSFSAKTAVQTFKKRFGTKEPKVIALTLELVDMAMAKCGNPLHVQVCTKEFMNILVSFLNMKGLPQPVTLAESDKLQIIKRILSLIQKWGLRFEKDRDILPLFNDVYLALKNKGIPFPEPEKSQQPSAPAPSMQKTGSGTVKVGKKYEKLLQDMNLVKGNINLTNMIIDTSKPQDLSKEDTPLNDLIKTLKEMEPKLFQLVATLEDEEMLKVCLLVNDDLHKTFGRYQKLKNGKKPEVFMPGESNANTPLVPTNLYEKQDLKQARKQEEGQAPGQSRQEVEDLFDLMGGANAPPQQQNLPPPQPAPQRQAPPAQAYQQPPPQPVSQPAPQQFQPPPQQFQQPSQYQQPPPQPKPQQKPANDPISQLNDIMKSMEIMTEQNVSNNPQMGQGAGMMGGQFPNNPMGMGYNPMMNQFMTGMPPMGMMGMPGYPNQFGTNMNPMMGQPFGFPQQTFATNAPPQGQNYGPGIGQGGSFPQGTNQNVLDSFKRDGYNIMGNQPQKVDDEGAKEFADLFNLADTKIKDRNNDYQKPSFEYNPIYQNQNAGLQNMQQQPMAPEPMGMGFGQPQPGPAFQDPIPSYSQNNDLFSGPSMTQQNPPAFFDGGSQGNAPPGFDFSTNQPNLGGDFSAGSQPEFGKVSDDMFGDFSVTQSMDNMNLNNQSQQNQQDLFDMFS